MTLTFIAPDRSVAVDLLGSATKTMLRHCAQAGHRETGGVLVGRYSEFGDRVAIVKASGPPADSRCLPTSFVRGIRGLSARFQREWTSGLYYIGEWHFHPFASPVPSPRDRRQIGEFAANPELRCRTPILAVLGGNPKEHWTIAVGVAADSGLIPLKEKSKSS